MAKRAVTDVTVSDKRNRGRPPKKWYDLWLGTIIAVIFFKFYRFLCQQVEYAMEAIGHAGTCLGILANDGKA